MKEEIPICNRCKKKMFKEKKNGFNYWQCKKRCVFHYPVFEEKLTKNEKLFIKQLK